MLNKAINDSVFHFIAKFVYTYYIFKYLVQITINLKTNIECHEIKLSKRQRAYT